MKQCFTRVFLVLAVVGLIMASASAALAVANSDYTKTVEKYPPPPDCPPYCPFMICVICSQSGGTPGVTPAVALEVSYLIPDTAVISDYSVVTRDATGLPVPLPGGGTLSFTRCDSCFGAAADSIPPAGMRWLNFRSQPVDWTNGVLQFVPYPVMSNGAPIPQAFWASDTGDDNGTSTVTNLLTSFPEQPVATDEQGWGELKTKFAEK